MPQNKITNEPEKRPIDANVLIEHLNRCIEQSKGLMRSVCVAIKCFVEQMPTVDTVEVVHGQWVYSGEPDDDGNIQAHCSVCDAGDRHAPCMIGHVPYCWKCGAKMDGGADND